MGVMQGMMWSICGKYERDCGIPAVVVSQIVSAG